MRILVSNDDGIHSPGIAALAEVASEFGTVRVVAPDVERSSAGHAITSSVPLSYRSTRIGNLNAYRVNGTPADCVALGSHHWESVDLVLSGLNLGFNLGNAIWHSGTLAAAKQAVLLGLRGVALSVPAGIDQDFEPVKPWVRRVLEIVIAEPSISLVNVNLPRQPRGLLWTRVSVRQYRRTHRSCDGSAGPSPLLVHGEAAGGGRRRYRSLGRGAELDLAHTVEARSDGRGTTERCRATPAAGSRACRGNVAADIVFRSGEGGSGRRSHCAGRTLVKFMRSPGAFSTCM